MARTVLANVDELVSVIRELLDAPSMLDSPLELGLSMPVLSPLLAAEQKSEASPVFLSLEDAALQQAGPADSGDSTLGRLVICAPPQSAGLSIEGQTAYQQVCDELAIEPPRKTAWAFAAVALHLAGEHGAAILLMEHAQLSRMAWRVGQKGCVEQQYLQTVVSLPHPVRIALTDSETGDSLPAQYDALVVLSRSNDAVRFIDARNTTGATAAEVSAASLLDSAPSAIVNYPRIMANGYVLNPERYLTKRIAPKRGVPLGELAVVKRGIPRFKLKDLTPLPLQEGSSPIVPADEPSPVAYLASSDFRHGRDYCSIGQAPDGVQCSALGNVQPPCWFHHESIEELGLRTYTGTRILISRTGYPFKVCRLSPDAFTTQTDTYLLADNLYGVDITSDIDPIYLLAFLSSDQGQLMLEQTATGTSALHQISPHDLRKMLVPVPSQDEQATIATAFLDMQQRLLELERRTESVVQERNDLFGHRLMGGK